MRPTLIAIPLVVAAVLVVGVVGAGTAAWQVVVIAVLSAPLVLSVWALLDVARRPRWVWALAGRSQPLWLAAVLFGMLLLVIGLLVSLVYLLSVRPQLARLEEGELPTW